MTGEELALRRAIMASFAATGAPPPVADGPALRGLERAHVVVLAPAGEDGVGIHMAHPFAGHRDGTQVTAPGGGWWGSCAWDGLGIVAALGLADADVRSGAITLRVRGGGLQDAGDAVFHVAVPARRWWEDIVFT